MSIISESFRPASIEAQSLLGETFYFKNLPYIGVFSTKQENVTQEDIGYMTVTKFSVVATKDQFTTAPTENDKITKDGIIYFIESVVTTQLHYKCELVRQTV